MSHAAYMFMKRAFDLLSSLLAIIVLSPLWIAISIGIKLSSKGPVFYTTERVGKDSKMFTVYKFRSMHVIDPNAEGSSNEHTYFANEDRIFKLGRVLRASKLDELPQLLNILMGQMSVVGPRPVPKVTAQNNYSGENASILTVRPGLACFDSLFDYAHGELFENDIEHYRKQIVPVRNELAKMYVESRNIGVDFYCIWRTIYLIFEIMILKKRDFPYTKYEAEAEKRVFAVATEE